jgi:hypothetical protein
LSPSTRSGRARGRPGPSQGTRMASSTAVNCGESPRWPAVNQDDQRLLALLAGQVDLRGQPAPGPAEGVIGRLGGQAARRFLLGLAVPARPGGVLVSPADRGVDVHRPSDATVRVGSRLELGEQPCPHAQALPAAEQSVDRLPGPIAGWEVTPRSPGLRSPPDSVDQHPLRPGRPARRRCGRQKRLQHGPLII